MFVFFFFFPFFFIVFLLDRDLCTKRETELREIKDLQRTQQYNKRLTKTQIFSAKVHEEAKQKRGGGGVTRSDIENTKKKSCTIFLL